jgi:pyruvate/2-oxoglutarate dehydrogenase complex dihydrolipoamide dehydrogenase (E3) component
MKGEGVYNLVVIGAGTAGLVAAAGTAGLGGRVALVERSRMGGECLNTGCVPSKALLSTARLAQRIRRASDWALDSRLSEIDLERVLTRVRERRRTIAPNDSQERFESLGVDVFRGSARFTSPHEVDVDGLTLRGRNFLIATGSRPAVPPVPGLTDFSFFTNETIFDRLERKPEHLIVLGGGLMGCELGQAFARLGVTTTIVQSAPRLLEKEDEDAAQLVARRLEAEGVEVLTDATATLVARHDLTARIWIETSGGRRSVDGDAILVAAGRIANTEDLGLDRAGVAVGKRGVTVDEHLRTSHRHIYAAGDVTGSYRFTHVADAQARTVVRNVLVPWFPEKFDASVIPWCTYTEPEIARVGINERQAREREIGYDAWIQPLYEVDRAVVESETEGFAKVLTAKGTDRILGATLVGERAGDVLSEIVLAMKAGLGLKRISQTIHAYPTFAEVVRKVADAQQRSRLTPSAKKLLGWLYRRRR